MAKRSKKKSGEILVVQSKVKDYIRDKGFRTSAEFVEALSEEVEILIDHAIDRAGTNKRQTVYGGDL
jgi:histone H3/H4